MLTKTLIKALAIAGLVAISFGAQAFSTYSGQDIDGSSVTRSSFTNANSAASSFLSHLVGVGTEDFEGLTGNAPLALNFVGAGAATLTGSASVATQATGTNGVGRYPHSGNKYLATDSTNFNVAFGSSVAAFGFYGVDIGDFGGDLWIRVTFAGGGTQDIDVPNPVGSNGTPDGSALYFGLIADSAAELFTNIQFFDTNPSGGDIFAFDDMTVGSLEQVCRVNCGNSVPEPGGLALAGLALTGLALVRRRKSS